MHGIYVFCRTCNHRKHRSSGDFSRSAAMATSTSATVAATTTAPIVVQATTPTPALLPQSAGTTRSVTPGTAIPPVTTVAVPSVASGTTTHPRTAVTTPSVTPVTHPATTVTVALGTTPSVTTGTAAASAGTCLVVGQLNDRAYIRWLKATHALNRTIDVLRNFCNVEMSTFHQFLMGRCGSTLCSGTCSSSDARFVRGSWTINCPNNVCSKWLTEIAAWRTLPSTKLTTHNADIRQWPQQPWQVAKMYMGRGQDQLSINSSDIDASGVMQLLTNCKHFASVVDATKVDAVSINLIILL